ncbi:MAG TPA: S8 family serine peptidase [Cerasibacillus sp.]|uniref:S8 family serine peptidase n=1 Tax=Cerasibacillus sp. TaxID=2498711 RepID=UPI002F41CBA6
MVFSLFAPTISAHTQDVKNSGKLHESVNDSKQLTKNKLSKKLLDEFKDDEYVRFMVKFKETANVDKVAKTAKKQAQKANLSANRSLFMQRSAVVSELKATSHESQQDVKAFLEEQMNEGSVKDFHSYFIVNGMAVTATKEIAEKIAAFHEVEKILPDEKRQLHAATKTNEKAPTAKLENVEWNIERVKAPETWNLGVDGTGTVVASLDTGVQWDHPALKEKYRGYDSATGEVDHQFSFLDATAAGREASYDDNGHGTHVTGTMVGSEPDGSNQIGVAPGAEWIAVKVFDGGGSTSDSILLNGAEWILAPGGRVDLAPDVVNNSWGGGPGLDEWYRDAVRAWRASEIFPEFSAGNTRIGNPGGPGSIAVPANYPESFATGATDSNDMIANFSLRGPSPYDEIKPDISAPGVNIRSSVPGSGYEGGWNGTSMSGPAVSGVAALLRQVNANISVDEMETILTSTADPRTDSEYSEVPNNGYGHGIVNAFDAVSSILSGVGTIEGTVTIDGEDTEEPTFEHTPINETFSQLDVDLTVQARDNISVTSVKLSYKIDSGDWTTVEANRVSGDFRDGEYAVKIKGDVVEGDTLTYKWLINDFGNNEVESDEYTVDILEGISTGYFHDFESQPIGWTSFGDNDSWEWGVPTSGPESAASGEKVYATNLSGNYESSMNATLVMPPVDLPEGGAVLKFKNWHNFEESSTGRAWDYGHVVISTDMEDWTELQMFQGLTSDWEDVEIDLSDYSGRVYIGFKAYSDFSVVRDGWYIDDVQLVEVGQTGKKSNALNADKKASKDQVKKKKQVKPSQLPLGAKVSVLETGRSVQSNPADGSFSFIHSAGDFTVVAEAYGYQSEQETVTVNADETSSVHFVLQELAQSVITGTVTDESTGAIVDGATVMLVEDANIAPVETNEGGEFSLTAYHGTYTLKVMALGYHSKEVEVTLDKDMELNIELEPYYTYPGGEIGYDDGTAENARAFYDAGNGWAVKMSLPEGKDSAIVTDGVFRFWETDWPSPGGTEFQVEVWDATGTDGQPGKKLVGPIDAEALRNGEWTVVDLREHNIIVNGDFYMVYIQTRDNPYAPGLATDESSANAGRSYQYVSGNWSKSPADEGNYMIRARVAYEVDTPVITTPAESFVTNEANMTIEGTASPTTTIQLLNNGEEVGSADIGENGTFSFDMELTEGVNEFKAVSIQNGGKTGESETVTVTLDTVNPELSIDSPRNNDKTNRETVTVEGSVADENLDSVTVNGQKTKINDNGTFAKRILLDNGANEIEVVAVDLAGNTTTKTVTLYAQYDAPEIINLTPSEDKYLESGDSIKIEFESAPDLNATFAVYLPLANLSSTDNPVELPMMEVSPGKYVGYWTVPKGVQANGGQIEVKVKDSFGNESRKKAEGKLFINVE